MVSVDVKRHHWTGTWHPHTRPRDCRSSVGMWGRWTFPRTVTCENAQLHDNVAAAWATVHTVHIRSYQKLRNDLLIMWTVNAEHQHCRQTSRCPPLVEVLSLYFTSTETIGLLGTGAQDVHLDFHTAPELCVSTANPTHSSLLPFTWKCVVWVFNTCTLYPAVHYQHTRELIISPKLSHKHDSTDMSRLR